MMRPSSVAMLYISTRRTTCCQVRNTHPGTMCGMGNVFCSCRPCACAAAGSATLERVCANVGQGCGKSRTRLAAVPEAQRVALEEKELEIKE